MRPRRYGRDQDQILPELTNGDEASRKLAVLPRSGYHRTFLRRQTCGWWWAWRRRLCSRGRRECIEGKPDEASLDRRIEPTGLARCYLWMVYCLGCFPRAAPLLGTCANLNRILSCLYVSTYQLRGRKSGQLRRRSDRAVQGGAMTTTYINIAWYWCHAYHRE